MHFGAIKNNVVEHKSRKQIELHTLDGKQLGLDSTLSHVSAEIKIYGGSYVPRAR